MKGPGQVFYSFSLQTERCGCGFAEVSPCGDGTVPSGQMKEVVVEFVGANGTLQCCLGIREG